MRKLKFVQHMVGCEIQCFMAHHVIEAVDYYKCIEKMAPHLGSCGLLHGKEKWKRKGQHSINGTPSKPAITWEMTTLITHHIRICEKCKGKLRTTFIFSSFTGITKY